MRALEFSVTRLAQSVIDMSTPIPQLRSSSQNSATLVGVSAFLLLTGCSESAKHTPGTSVAMNSGGSASTGTGGTGSGSSSGTLQGVGGKATTGAGGKSTGSGGASGGIGGSPAAGGTSGRDFSGNRALFFGASRCAAANVQFCEDFESGVLNTGTWQTSGATPIIDGVQAARGTKALHIVQQGNGNSRISETKTFPAMNGRYWGRAFVYFNAMPHHSAAADSLDYSHWTIIAATGGVVNGEVRIGGQLQQRYQNTTPLNFFGVGTDNRNQAGGTGDWTNADDDPSGAALPVAEKQWSCIEWLGDSTTDETKFFLDGVEHPSLGTTPATPHKGNAAQPFLLPEFAAIWFGFAEYQTTTQAFEVWFDEIAIDHERIGCVQ